MTPENLAFKRELTETANDRLFALAAALEEERARDPSGTDPRYVIATGEPRVFCDYEQSTGRGNHFGYVMGKHFGLLGVYKFQSKRQAELVASVTKNGHGVYGKVYTFAESLEYEMAEMRSLRDMFSTKLVPA